MQSKLSSGLESLLSQTDYGINRKTQIDRNPILRSRISWIYVYVFIRFSDGKHKKLHLNVTIFQMNRLDFSILVH